MKKFLSVLLVSIVLFSIGSPVSAAMPSTDTIVPMWDNIQSATPFLHFSGTSGYSSAKIVAKPGATEISASLAVYKQVGDSWEYVDHDSGRTTSSLSYGLSVNFQGEPGAYYKAVLNMTVTKNGVAENEILFSYATCPTGN